MSNLFPKLRYEHVKGYSGVKISGSVWLQNVGHVKGSLAGELKVGDYLMWNYGIASRVKSIVKQTANRVFIEEEFESAGKLESAVRRLSKTRYVARAYEITPEEHETLKR